MPKKSTDHEPMPLSVNLDGEDTIVILYDHSEDTNIDDVIYILAAEYPTTLNSLNTLSCSSTNSESFVNFIKRELDT